MRLDNLVKVSFVKGGARILDCLMPSQPGPHAPRPLNSWPVTRSRGGTQSRSRTLSEVAASPCCPPSTALPSLPPELSWKEAQEKRRRHTVSWAQGQVTFPIQHLYKSYLMKLRGKKN